VTRRFACLVSIGTVALLLYLSRPVRAQRVDFGSARPSPALDVHAALLQAAGPLSLVRRDASGAIRMLFGARIPPWSGDPARDAFALTQRFGEALGIPRGSEFRLESVQRWHGFTIVRLRRFVGGRRVIGAGVLVRTIADGTIDLVIAAPGPAVVEAARPDVDATRAEALARTVRLGWSIVGTTPAEPEALALPDAVVPTWRVDVHGAAETQRARVWIDAHRGTVLGAMPLIASARGRVFATNPRSTMGETTDVDLVDLTSAEHLTGTYFRVRSCNAQPSGGCAADHLARSDADGNFLFDPAPTAYDDPFAEVNAYHHLSVAAAHFRERHGFRLACSAAMEVLVNYTELPETPYENAGYTRSSKCGCLIFGQGATADFAYDADIVYHEYGHVVTDQVAAIADVLVDSLGISYEPLAVNEGTSDYYAATIQGDPYIAESLSDLDVGFGGSHGGLRVLEHDLRCPDALFGEGHVDGQLWSGVTWELRSRLGEEKADVLVFTTVASMMESPSLAEAADLLIATAMGMQAMGTLRADDVAAVQRAVEERGLLGCQRIVPLDGAAMRIGWSGSERWTGTLGRSIAPIHYRLEVPVDATRIELSLGRLTFTGRYQIHASVASPVRVQAGRVVSEAVLFPDERGHVALDLTTMPWALSRCRTLFFALEATDLSTDGQSVYTIQAAVTRSGDPDATCPVIENDAGGAIDGGVGRDDAGPRIVPRGGGCHCRAGIGRSAPPGWATFVAFAGALALWCERRPVGRGRRRGDQMPSQLRAFCARVPRRT
jgi:hypothetical protein